MKRPISAETIHSRAMAALLLSALICLSPRSTHAQSAPARPAAGSNRYLLIVQTSRPMQKQADAVLKFVYDMLGSGLKGQLRPGDSLGVWTFNDELHAGVFPLQQWSTNTQPAISSRVLNFLKAQKYEKNADLRPVMTGLKAVVKASEFITVILISDGKEKLSGTPFDIQINEFYGKWLVEQQKAKLPFATVLQAKRGQIVNYAVTPAPWPVEMPPLPPELVAAAEKAAAAAPKPQPSAVPPLIVVGKKNAALQSSNALPLLEPKALAEAANASGAPEKSAVTSARAAPAPASPAAVIVEKSSIARTSSPPSATAALVPGSGAATAPSAPGSIAAQLPVQLPAAGVPSQLEARASNAPATPAAQTGTVVAPASFLQRKGVWVVGGIVLAAALGLIVVLSRRHRGSARASLITHSLDREKK